VTKDGGLLALDLPAHASRPDPGPEELPDALGARPLEVFAVRDNWLAVYADEAAVRALEPDFRRLAAIARHGVIATAPGDDVDFVSRFFAPAVGVDEDPVTGSAHCALVPFWAQRLGRHTLRARQVSRRGGDLLCTLDGQRVRLGGEAVLYLEGRITVSSGLLE
jgi:predicted PhzF superfamily epimerase YddE/YHI9